jgi:hypothetical protein
VNFGQEQPILSSSNPSVGGKIRAFVFVTSMILASLACQVNLGGPERPGSPIPASTQAAESLQSQWADALAGAADQGNVVLKIDEAQLTSFLASRLSKQPELGIKNPQVSLRQGEIQFYATLDRGIIRASLLMGVSPNVDAEGNLTFEITSADFGPIPIPDLLKKSVSAAITEAFAGSLGPLATGIDIKSVDVADGEMTITGTFR